MNDDTLRDALRHGPALEVDGAFVDTLEARLRDADASAETPVAELEEPPEHRRSPRRMLLVAAALLIVVALLAALVAIGHNDDTTPTGTSGPVLGYRIASTEKSADTARVQYPDVALSDVSVDAVHKAARYNARYSNGTPAITDGVFVNGTTYVSVADWRRANLPPNAAQLRILDHKHWVGNGGPTFPFDSRTFSVDALIDGSPFVASFDVLTELQRRHVALRAIGDSQVRGVPTTGYRFTRSTSQKYSYGVGVTHTTVEVWIDGAGRLRRLRVHEQIPETYDNAPQTLDAVTDYFDFGRQTTITAPDPRDVADSRALSAAFQCQPIPIEPAQC